MTWLLKLYPREWRRHYGAELEELVVSQPKSLQLAIDLLGGAVDAHMKPQAFARRLDDATAGESGGLDMFTRTKCCGANARMSRKEAFLGAALTIGSALVIAAIMVIGHSPLTEAVGVTMFPGATALTLMLCGANSTASIRVKPWMAILDTPYARQPGTPLCPKIEPTLIILPFFCFIMCGATAFAQRK